MSRKISGKEVYELIDESEAIVIHDANTALCYPSEDETDEGEYELFLAYDYDGCEFSYNFEWSEKDEFEIKDNKIIMIEDNGNEVPIEILISKQL